MPISKNGGSGEDTSQVPLNGPAASSAHPAVDPLLDPDLLPRGENEPAAGRVLITGLSEARRTAWCEAVRALGYETVRAEPEEAATARARADCVLAETPLPAAVLKALLSQGDRTPPSVPPAEERADLVPVMILTGDPATGPHGQELAERQGSLPDPFSSEPAAAAPPAFQRQIARRLATMIRLRSMSEAWRRRHTILRTEHIDPGVPESALRLAADRERTLLFAGGPAMDYAPIEGRLADARTTVVGSLTPPTTIEYLARHSFDTLVIHVADTVDPYLPVIIAARRNPRLTATPILLLLSPDRPEDAARALQAGATDALTRPMNEDELVIRIEAALAESSQRKALAEVLNAPWPAGLAEPELSGPGFAGCPGLAGASVLEAWLDLCLEEHSPFSMLTFDLSQARAAGPAEPALQSTPLNAFAMACALVQSITRAGDLVARAGPRHLAVVLPRCGKATGIRVLRRLTGALTATRFEDEGGQGLGLLPRACVVSHTAAASGRALLAQARGRLGGAAMDPAGPSGPARA